MKALIVKRLLQAVVTLLTVSVLIFVGTQVLPGDVAVAMLGQSASDETLAAMRKDLGLERSAPVQYVHWLQGFFTGDMGRSLANRQAIGPELRSRLGNTLFLASVAASIAVPLALAFGIAAAVWSNGILDKTISSLGLLAISLPEFFIAYLLILFLSVEYDIFPSLAAVSRDTPLGERLEAIALPAITLVLAVFAYIMRMTRTAILSSLQRPFIEMAILKGVPRWRLVLLHALPAALAPVIQVITFNLAYMVVGIVLVEVVFVYPGIGQYLVDAVSKRDVTVVQACGLVFGATFVLLNLVSDVVTILLNPRLRYAR